MKRNIVAFFLAGVLLLCGCQKTPEEPIVVQKDTDRLVEQMQDAQSEETVVFDRNDVPDRMEKEITGKTGKMTVNVDADIVLPEADEIPVYRAKAVDFSQDIVTLMFDRFRDGKEMFTFPDTLTKEELGEMILLVREQLEERLNDPTLKNDTELIDRNKKDLEKYLAEYEKAPEKIEGVPSEGMLEEKAFTDGKGKLIGMYDYAGGEDKERTFGFCVENNVDAKKIPKKTETETEYGISSVGYTESFNAFMLYSVYEKFSNGDEPRNYMQHTMQRITDESKVPQEAEGYLTITPKQAREMAEELLADTGMATQDIFLTDDENCGNFDGLVSPAQNYAYKLFCVRKVDGINCTYLDDATQSGEDDFAPRWYYERMEMLIDDDGIFSFEWWAPIELTEQITQNAEILPFEKIESIFEKMIVIENEGLLAFEKYQNCELAFDVDRIELLLHRIPEGNSEDTGLVVPVWCFYGLGYTVDGSGNKEMLKSWWDGTKQPLLMINAIDGTIIDTSKGY